MSSVWKTPCGSDRVPEMVVKIIGSKYFQYLVEKPKTQENENLKAETQRALQESVHGNKRQMSGDPPASSDPTDHQFSQDPDDVEESKHPENNWKPENIQKPENDQKLPTGALSSRFLDSKANVHCISVPTGDQSQSYIHGLPRRKRRDWSLEQMRKGSSDQPKDIGQGQRPEPETKEDIFLLALVRRELKAHFLSSGLLDKLQKELKTLDTVSSGSLLQSQLSHLFLKHEVPLQLPTIKILCQRFSSRGSPEMVNYEKLLWFLKVAASDDPQQSKRVVGSHLGGSHHSESFCPAPPRGTAPQDSISQSEVNKSLLELLKMVLRTTNGKLNTEKLNLSFRKEDRSFSGYLPPPKVRAICGKHGLCLTLSLLETLLNHQDLGYQGEIKWENFVELLSRASSDLASDLPTGKTIKESSATPVQPEVPEMSRGKTEHVKTPKEELQPENLPAETSVPKDPQSSLMIRPVSQPFVSLVTKNKTEECETWINRFTKLENALYLCDLSNTGVLEKERTRRLIHNYNLIYNLSLSPWKINQALKRFCSGGNMLLEPALQYLKEL